MSENTNDSLSTESTEQVTTPLTQKEIIEKRKATRAYFKEQIENLKPQVELAELRTRFSKAIFDNYRYGLELNKIQNAENELENKANKDTASGPTEAPVVSINKNQEVVNEETNVSK